MSLTKEEKIRTRQELLANRRIYPLDDHTLCQALGWTPQQLADNLAVAASSSPGEV